MTAGCSFGGLQARSVQSLSSGETRHAVTQGRGRQSFCLSVQTTAISRFAPSAAPLQTRRMGDALLTAVILAFSASQQRLTGNDACVGQPAQAVPC